MYYTYLATSFTFQAAGQETVMFWIVVCGWSILRLPIIYYCLWAETQFWIKDDEEGRVRRLSRGVVNELQQFLDENRHILVDYFSIKFGRQIGSGATAQVYKGTKIALEHIKNTEKETHTLEHRNISWSRCCNQGVHTRSYRS